MPKYSVDFPDGHTQSFDGPANMSDADAFTRALQERAVSEGKIQTTWFGGAAKQASQEPGVVAPAIAGAGMLAATAGAPVAVASAATAIAPLAARWLQFASQKYYDQERQMPTAGENALLAGEGLLGGYGAKALGTVGAEAGTLTRAHQLPNGQWVQGLKGSGIMPWMGRVAGEVGERAGSAIDQSVLNPEAVASRAQSGMGQMADAVKNAIFGATKQSFTAAETARGLAMLKAGVPQDQVIKILLSQRP